jgi:alpha/beta hydrolase fold
MAADVAGLMDRLDLPRAHLLGISMGGRIAMALALVHPGRVDRLVLVATSPRAAGARWLVRAGMMVADLPVLRGRHRQPRYAMKAQFDATTRFDCTAGLSQIGAPVLIVHGKSDHIAPVALAEQMHDLIPGSRLVLIDGGHLAPLLTQHERLVSETCAFLAASPWHSHLARVRRLTHRQPVRRTERPDGQPIPRLPDPPSGVADGACRVVISAARHGMLCAWGSWSVEQVRNSPGSGLPAAGSRRGCRA